MDVLILNSAQSKRPRGSDTWIVATIKAAESAVERGDTLIIGHDPLQWDFTAYLAGRLGVRATMIVNGLEDETGCREYTRLIDDLGLDGIMIEPLFAGARNDARPKTVWPVRDRMAIGRADTIYPVSIRPGGKLAALISDDGVVEKKRDDFRVAWKLGTVNESKIPIKDAVVRPFPPGDWLVHWTRTCHGPWPGERSRDFFEDMLARPDIYVRSAFETLTRITREGVVRGSEWRISGANRAVSLTSLGASESLQLMRWRKRYVRYSFEPYGVAFRRDAVVAMGGRPVDYVAGSGNDHGTGELFIQPEGARGDWAKECEWRFPGDMRLDAFSHDDVLLVVPDERTAQEMFDRNGECFPVHSLSEYDIRTCCGEK